MCDFCESITDRNKKITWNVRSTYADDNICEYVNNNMCSSCGNCNMYFTLDGYDINGSVYVGASYNQYLKDGLGTEVIIRPFTETVRLNYCPFCGKQISKEILGFERCTKNGISIEIEEID